MSAVGILDIVGALNFVFKSIVNHCLFYLSVAKEGYWYLYTWFRNVWYYSNLIVLDIKIVIKVNVLNIPQGTIMNILWPINTCFR